jgi:hypothetical protein
MPPLIVTGQHALPEDLDTVNRLAAACVPAARRAVYRLKYTGFDRERCLEGLWGAVQEARAVMPERGPLDLELINASGRRVYVGQLPFPGAHAAAVGFGEWALSAPWKYRPSRAPYSAALIGQGDTWQSLNDDQWGTVRMLFSEVELPAEDELLVEMSRELARAVERRPNVLTLLRAGVSPVALSALLGRGTPGVERPKVSGPQPQHYVIGRQTPPPSQLLETFARWKPDPAWGVAAVALLGEGEPPLLFDVRQDKALTGPQYKVLAALLMAGPLGLTGDRMTGVAGAGDGLGVFKRLRKKSHDWAKALVPSGEKRERYRILWRAHLPPTGAPTKSTGQ